MRAVVCRGFDGIDALRLEDIAEPVPGPGQVLIGVHVAALSFMDTLVVAGRYQMKPALPFVPGSDVAGRVVAVGEDVDGLAAGDRVACSHWTGGLAERMVASRSTVVGIPDNVDDATATTVRYAYGTARYALVVRAALRQGETVFVSGAAGGVGLAAVELASRMGAIVIAGASSAARCDMARSQGAHHAIDYSRESLRDRLLAITDGRGVDVFFDNVGGELFATASRAMAWGGRILPIGFTSGVIPTMAMNLPLLKSFSVIGCFWGAWSERQPMCSHEADTMLMRDVAAGMLRPKVSEVLPMAKFRDGLHRIANRQATGRIVVRINDSAHRA